MLRKAQHWLLARDNDPTVVYRQDRLPFPVAYVFKIQRVGKASVFFLMLLDKYCKPESFRRICTY